MRFFIIGALAFGTGCASQHATQRYAQVANKSANGPAAPQTPGAAPERAAVPSGDCELRLYIEQRPSDGYYGIDDKHLGVSVVERAGAWEDNRKKFVDGVCVKKKDAALELPAGLLVASPDDDEGALGRFCLPAPEAIEAEKDGADKGDDGSGKMGNCDGKSSGPCVGVSTCQWNGRFHSSRPFTFTLVAAKDAKVGDFVELVRIYRNGDLMAAWNRTSDQKNPGEVALGGNALRSGFWAATLPPHLAALDFRVVPRGTEIGDAVDLTVRNDHDLFRRRVTQALLDGALPEGSPARESLDCLKDAVVRAHEEIKKTIRGEGGLPQLKTTCEMSLGLVHGTPLSDKYADVKNHTRDKLIELKNDAEAELEKAQKTLESKLPEAAKKALKEGADKLLAAAKAEVREKVKAELAKEPKTELVDFLERERKALGLNPEINDLNTLYVTFGLLKKDVDSQVTFGLRAVDEARALALELYDEARRVGTDTERQAQLFNAVAESLRSQGDVFEARRDNPVLLVGEQAMPMEYSDHWQGFMLAPWNGVPIRPKQAEADISAAIAIPLIDFFGVRLQWGKSRFAEARAAIGGGYTATTRVNADGTETTKSAFLPNVSLGFGTFKLGLGVVTVKTGPKFNDQIRIIIGADLMKLLTGSNVEVL